MRLHHHHYRDVHARRFGRLVPKSSASARLTVGVHHGAQRPLLGAHGMPTKVVTDLPARDAENRHDGVRIDRDASATLALLQTVKKRPDVRCCSPVDGMAPVADAVNDRPAVSASAVGLAPFEG